MLIERLIESMLWGSDKWKAEYYNRMGDCFYFSFFRFQIIRSIFLLLMIIMTFLMLYFDLRMFLFLIQDWKILINCIAILSIFVFSGKQRSEILHVTLIKTGAGLKLKNASKESLKDDSDDQEEIKGYSMWKTVVLIYEFAQTLSLFHTFMFFFFWHQSMHDYYWHKEPQTQINKVMRILIMWVINVFPPLFMIFDMVFSKILFRLRHFWVGLICSAIFFCIQTIGRRVIPSKEFPSDVEELGTVLNVFFAICGYVFCHFLLWLISYAKKRLSQNPSLKKKDNRIELILSKYNTYMVEKEIVRRQIHYEESTGLLLSSKDIHIDDNPTLVFMKEVLYNYLDKELKIKRED